MKRSEFIAEIVSALALRHIEERACTDFRALAGRVTAFADAAQELGAFDEENARELAVVEAIDRMKELADGSNLAWPAGLSAVLDARSMFP